MHIMMDSDFYYDKLGTGKLTSLKFGDFYLDSNLGTSGTYYTNSVNNEMLFEIEYRVNPSNNER